MVYYDCDHCLKLGKGYFDKEGKEQQQDGWHKFKLRGQVKTTCSTECMMHILKAHGENK